MEQLDVLLGRRGGDGEDRCGEMRRKVHPKTQVPNPGTWGTLRAILNCAPEKSYPVRSAESL